MRIKKLNSQLGIVIVGLLLIALALATFAVVGTLMGQLDQARRAQVVIGLVQNRMGQLNGAIWNDEDAHRPETFIQGKSAVEAEIERLRRLDPGRAEAVGQLAERVFVVFSGIVQAVARSDYEGADRVERMGQADVGRFYGTLVDFSQELGGIADRSRRQAILGSALAIFLAIGAVAFFLLRTRVAWHRARQAEESLLAQNERLLELDRLKDSFVASVSHELRTPLTSILGYTQLLIEMDSEADGSYGADGDQRREFVGVIARNSNRLMALVQDLLLVARLDSGGVLVDRKPIDLAEVTRSSVESLAPQAAEAGLALSLESPETLPLVADPTRMAQIVENLLGNALKFTPSGGSVKIALAAVGGEARLRVSDSGIGISEDAQARLFERFFRAEEAIARAIPGTGLGLAVVQGIVLAHGGSIEVESRVGRGATFVVRLPLALSIDQRSELDLAAA